MLGSFSLSVFIKGTQNMGSEPSSTLRTLSELSRSTLMGFPLVAQRVWTSKDSSFFCSLPYTTGVAMASTPQAAKNLSPVLAAIR